ncbi:Uncharacterised protein [Vibrio cholerae]|nr:Uncharacterised protein [Vibrio cholerae]
MPPRKQLPTNDVINHQHHCDDDAQKLAASERKQPDGQCRAELAFENHAG